MRHIPEAELHAYLDQALNRAQCVDIERHLDACAACQSLRDEIAALRDRTTALLSRLGPAVPTAPPFDVIQSRTAAELSARRRRMQLIAWAASIAVAAGLGWLGGSVFESNRAATTGGIARVATTAKPSQPAKAPPTEARSTRGPSSAASSPAAPARAQVKAPARVDDPGVTVKDRSGKPTRLMEPVKDLVLGPTKSSAEPVVVVGGIKPQQSARPGSNGELVFDSTWRTLSWDGAQAEAGGKAPPHINGLPVMQVQVQKNTGGTPPLMVVAQQLSSGEVIRTIEGPASDVSRLLGRRVMTDPVRPAFDSMTQIDSVRPAQIGQAMAMQRGDRMIAITGAIPSDSLRAIVRRLSETGKR